MEIREKYFCLDEYIKNVIAYIYDKNKPFTITEIQHKFRIGYIRATKLVGWLEKYDIIKGNDCSSYVLNASKEDIKLLLDRIEIFSNY